MTGMVIIGAGMAGYRACVSLRATGYVGEITLIGDEQHLPYDRPPLSKSAISDRANPSPVWLMDHGIAASLNVTLRLDDAAQALSRDRQMVVCRTGELAYDKLLLATGARARKLSLPGGEHALTLRTFEEAKHLRDRFQPGQKIVIIGGGFIGLELASSASKRGCQVTVLEAQPRILMRGVPESIAQIVHDSHVAAGVAMRTGTSVASLAAKSVTLSDGTVIAADAIIAGIGASPETALAAAAGLAIENGIAVNAELQTSDPNIFAAGDCCSFPHPLFNNTRIRLEAWRNAQDQGTLAAENMLGANKAYKAVPWFWSDQYDLSLQVSGLPHLGVKTIRRDLAPNSHMLFHLMADGTLVGASGIGTGNGIARDIKLAEMLIAKSAKPDPAQLADPAVHLKTILKG